MYIRWRGKTNSFIRKPQFRERNGDVKNEWRTHRLNFISISNAYVWKRKLYSERRKSETAKVCLSRRVSGYTLTLTMYAMKQYAMHYEFTLLKNEHKWHNYIFRMNLSTLAQTFRITSKWTTKCWTTENTIRR